MSLLHYLLLAASLLLVSGNNDFYGIRALKQRPKTMPMFNLDKYLGMWYALFRKAPCSWSGSEDFVDDQTLIKRSALGVDMDLHMRMAGECVLVKVSGTINPDKPGEFTFADKIGRLIVGESAVVATDYKTFTIDWGCMKKTMDGRCDDPFLSIKTRSPNPGKPVLQVIQSILMNYWGIKLTDLQQIMHNSPCVPHHPFIQTKFG